MKNFTTLVLAVLLLTSLTSCRKVIGKGPTVTETRSPGAFKEIEFELPAELTYIESDRPEITIEAQRNIIDIIETNVIGPTLKVRIRHNTIIAPNENIKVTVMGLHVNSFRVSGSGDLSLPQSINEEQIKLKVDGSGSIVANTLKATGLEVKISGSGNIKGLNGEVTNEKINISGSGDVDLVDVSAKNVDTETSGSGDIKVFANERLNVRIAGSGDVWYKGRPVIDTKISGSGDVRRLD